MKRFGARESETPKLFEWRLICFSVAREFELSNLSCGNTLWLIALS